MTLRCLFVDFDSFFASVEQHDDARLRGRPVAVVPVASKTTCCIAASKEAKRDYDIKTGTGVAEALERCPDLALRLARPARYVRVHHRFLEAIATCIPHGEAASIDEVPCWLLGRERRRDNAEAIAHAIKRALREAFSDSLTCSIGIAPNRFLAKTASDMNKPDGLTVIEQGDLPHALHGLELRDLCGIGPSMERRLRAAGIERVAELCAAPRARLRQAWGSIEGERFWLRLRGFELPQPQARRGSIGHSHVLGPEFRDIDGARSVLAKLLAKAAMRLRDDRDDGPFLAGGMAVRVRFVGMEERFESDLRFAPLDDTPTLLRLLEQALAPLRDAAAARRWHSKRRPPLSVAVTLVDLVPRDACGELLPARRQAQAISALMDRVNRKFGYGALHTGTMARAIKSDAAPMRIPFQHVPDPDVEEEAGLHGVEQMPIDAMDLMQTRMNQFKVQAEQTHRQRTQRHHRPAGAGGWRRQPQDAPASPQASLF